MMLYNLPKIIKQEIAVMSIHVTAKVLLFPQFHFALLKQVLWTK